MAEYDGWLTRVAMANTEGYEVVFEGEDWSILQDKAEAQIYIASHVACNAADSMEDGTRTGRGGVMSWFNNEDAVCYYCSASVPDEIQALVHLAGSF